MKTMKLIVPFFLILFSIVMLISSFNLQKANLGNPYGPIYFPAGISIFMLIFSIIYLMQELKNIHKENPSIKLMLSGRTPRLICVTILFGIIYSFLFERVGFLISTFLFLGALLFFINGKRKWIVNTVVALSFSFISWYAFSELLGVSLP
ncbi:tripartite tricarboxylate transporter TctB family protein [Halobacillus halophilus]|uniref:tripartite tricarboxylate transporter TctB family protein n=1 Tax=Halobacillus halophilus TaxID=1570 RepID=UPI001CD3482F|nr:tripartite tricarboxylate transporter TctB family protein [Halobacillus halophilus]MCA1011442.1 tripartite tricarboxylate transporter TctB family protein [Halobacillus halophilus]